MSASENLLADDYKALQDRQLVTSPLRTATSEAQEIDWQLLRLDVSPSYMNGNKGYKLLPNLLRAREQGFEQIISFGGMHSNHLHALAHAAKRYGFKAVAVVRGYASQPLSESLQDCLRAGLQLHFADRQEYAKRYDGDYWQLLQQQYGASYMIAEGGSNETALDGVNILAHAIIQQLANFDYLCVASGTATTLAGLLPVSQTMQVLGFLALKNTAEVAVRLGEQANIKLLDQYHFGGFAKINADLAQFICQFEAQQGIALDPVYTAKMLYGIDDLMQQGYFKKQSRILAIHSGGVQGMRGMKDKIQSLASHNPPRTHTGRQAHA